jgi:O-antigen ligase
MSLAASAILLTWAVPPTLFLAAFAKSKKIGYLLSLVLYLGFFGHFGQQIIGIRISSMALSLFALYGVVSVSVKRVAVKAPTAPEWCALLLFCLVLGTFLTNKPADTLAITTGGVVVALFVGRITSLILSSTETQTAITLAFLGAGTFIAATIIIQWVIDPTLFGLTEEARYAFVRARPQSVYVGPTGAVVALIPVWALVLTLAVNRRIALVKPWSAPLAILLIGGGLTLTGSRSALAILLVTTLLSMYFARDQLPRRSRLLLPMALGFLLAVWGILIYYLGPWLGPGSTALTDIGARRSRHWLSAWQHLGDHPLLGLRYSKLVDTPGRVEIPNLHNDFLQVWTDVGLLGLTALLILLFSVMVIAYRHYRDQRSPMSLLILLSVPGAAFTGLTHNVVLTLLPLWVVVGCVIGTAQVGEPKETSRARGYGRSSAPPRS